MILIFHKFSNWRKKKDYNLEKDEKIYLLFYFASKVLLSFKVKEKSRSQFKTMLSLPAGEANPQ